MKVLDIHDLPPEDSLRLVLTSPFAPERELKKELEPFLSALEKYSDGWMPDVVSGRRHVKYSRASFWKALEQRRAEVGKRAYFYRTSSPALEMSLKLWFPPQLPELSIMATVQPLSFFANAERCHQLIELARDWASHYPVTHAAIHSLADRALAGTPYFGRDEKVARRDGFDKIYEVFWLNVLGPELVRSVGRERVLSAPAWRVEELPNGSILLVTGPTVADFASDAAREAQARLHLHLRPDLDPTTLRHTLRERSAALAPVQPRFPPDLTPLLTRVVDNFPIHERQREIARLNAWRPPEPKEWRPAHAALPSDVPEPERALQRYATLADNLVVMVHADVPSVLEGTIESLTDADFYFWREDYTHTRLREVLDSHVMPALGAWLGEMLVQHLEGEWIPRARLMEAQVRVGDRVWLPMVRAFHLLRSRQSILDFSLTQLYREAERHRGRSQRT